MPSPKRALVFLDELGLNTSVEQGLPLMWSICERLMAMPNVGTIVATHNKFLNQLASTYPSVKVLTIERLSHKLKDQHS